MNIGDKVIYNNIEWLCWFIEPIDNDKIIHMSSDDDAICVLESELKK